MKLGDIFNEGASDSEWVVTNTKNQNKFKTFAPDRKEAMKKGVARFGHRQVSVVKIN